MLFIISDCHMFLYVQYLLCKGFNRLPFIYGLYPLMCVLMLFVCHVCIFQYIYNLNMLMYKYMNNSVE